MGTKSYGKDYNRSGSKEIYLKNYLSSRLKKVHFTFMNARRSRKINKHWQKHIRVPMVRKGENPEACKGC